MRVQAAPGLQCPAENNPREYITDAVPVDVPDTAYYRRLVDDGSLREVKSEQSGVKGKKTTPSPLTPDASPSDKGGQ